MKLIIKEYLTLLKESDELDRLIPTLLLSMGIEPLSRAQKGVRQDGVDVAAVGKDENSIKTLFLFVIKQGDIGRADWEDGTQAVRPSLNEVKEVYLTGHIDPKHKGLPKKIILCTGGELKQDVERNWKGYINSNQDDGELEYDFWGGDRLAILIETHLFNEKILPDELQSRFRKALTLVSDPDYNLSDYYQILNEVFLETEYGDLQKTSAQKKVIKAFRTISVCQNIIYFWAKNEDNIKPAALCAERTVLYAWEFIRRKELYKNKKIANLFYELYGTLDRIYSDYFSKVQKNCYIRNGFIGYGRHYIQECLNVFEHLGLLSMTGLLCLYTALAEKNEVGIKNAHVVCDAVKNYIENHLATYSPCYDDHINEISETILFLSTLSENEFIDNWIREIVDKTCFSYHKMNGYFPIQSDSFDDLVALNVSGTINKEKLFELSTLLPILAHWCISLGLDETYDFIQQAVNDHFPDCTLQIWYPDKETEEKLYISHAGNTGAVDAPMELVESIEEMKKRIKIVQKNTIPANEISAIKHGMLLLPVIASRHYRTPLIPFYWQYPILQAENS